MNLDEIRKSEIVLLDANILVYGVLLKSNQCTRLLRRCAEREVIGVVGLHQLSEVMHRLMMVEARENGWATGRNAVRTLADRPERVSSMTRYADAIKGLLSSGFQYEPMLKEDFVTALAYQREYGILTNDSLVTALADRLRIQPVASADKSLAKVRGLILYSPDDLEE